MISVVIAILISATESFAEIISVVLRVDVVAVVAVGRVLISVAVAVVGTPTVFPVSGPGAEAFLVTGIHRLAQQICAVLIGLVVGAAAIVAINRRGVEVGIVVIVVTLITETPLLIPQVLQVVFLEAILRHSFLPLQCGGFLLEAALLLIQTLAILRNPLLLLLNQLLLPLL